MTPDAHRSFFPALPIRAKTPSRPSFFFFQRIFPFLSRVFRCCFILYGSSTLNIMISIIN